MIKKFFCITAFMWPCILAHAQSEKTSGISHTVDFPVGNAAWSVKIENDAGGGPESAANSAKRKVKKIDIVRVNDLRRDTVYWSDGGDTEYWWSTNPAITLFQTKPDGPIQTMRSSMLEIRCFDASIFSWVGADTFVDTKTYQGKECNHYKTSVNIVDDEKESREVWIDSKTHRPVAWKAGKTLAIFSFDTGAALGPLVMPEKFKQALKRYQDYYTPPKVIGT